MILLSHPTGNTFVRNALKAMHDEGLLAEFNTTLATFPSNLLGKLARTSFGTEFNRRRYDPELASLTRQQPFFEFFRLLNSRLGIRALTQHETGPFSVDSVYRHLDSFTAKQIKANGHLLTSVYAYEDGALNSFKTAKKSGINCLYDLPIAYWRLGWQIQEEEATLQPDWAMTLGALQDSEAKLARKDEELSLADAIFCASSFTRDSLKVYLPKLSVPVHVVPYGAPSEVLDEDDLSIPSPNNPLRLLFVGGLSQRKGLSYLFEAVDKLGKRVELTVIGRQPAVDCPALTRALSKHRYIETLPHEKVLAEMSRADVFVFPSLFEGFGLVLLEAMSRGVPCITTPHTAGPDFITNGEDGFIVPTREVDGIVDKLEILHQDRDRLMAMKHAALRTARHQTWTAYREGIVAALRQVLKS